jgi:hypothetical protein
MGFVCGSAALLCFPSSLLSSFLVVLLALDVDLVVLLALVVFVALLNVSLVVLVALNVDL